MLKDVRHCLAEAQALGVELRLAEVAERLYAQAAAEGHGGARLRRRRDGRRLSAAERPRTRKS